MTSDLSLSGAIRTCLDQGRIPVIVDIKPVSPRDGNLLRNREPADLARLAEQAGACAISVVTEPHHFGGCIDMLQDVARASRLPVLQKDFFQNPRQIEESHRAGADAILIIMANTSDKTARRLFQQAGRLGLEAVVEVHTPAELARALKLTPTIIGINNRDILALERDAGDVGVTEALAPGVPENVLILSESALQCSDDVRRAVLAGADAVLVGTAILMADDLERRLAELTAI